MKKIALKTMLLSVATLGMSVMVSCNSANKQHITAGDVEDAVEKLDALQDSANVVSLAVGYYEENDAEARYKLRRLAANEMITYKAEQINEYKQSWYGERVEEHVFVTVSLTEKGREYIVTEPIKSKEEEVKINYDEYPEASVALE